jgi:hypothetical protein
MPSHLRRQRLVSHRLSADDSPPAIAKRAPKEHGALFGDQDHASVVSETLVVGPYSDPNSVGLFTFDD